MMSFINDLLQRTKRDQQKNPPADQKAGQGPGLVWLIVCGGVVAMGAVFALNHKNNPTRSGEPVPVLARKAPATRPMAAHKSVPATSPSIVVSNPPPAITEVSKPAVRLQAIFFSAKRSSAMISGQTVFVNDRVGEFQVAAIATNSVTLVNHGETWVLKLGE
jgi:hypothetical protein